MCVPFGVNSYMLKPEMWPKVTKFKGPVTLEDPWIYSPFKSQIQHKQLLGLRLGEQVEAEISHTTSVVEISFSCTDNFGMITNQTFPVVIQTLEQLLTAILL